MSLKFPLLGPDGIPLSSMTRRRFLATSGVAGAGALLNPDLALASDEDPCAAALAVLKNAAREAEDPRPWARQYGPHAIDQLREQVDQAMSRLDAAEQREDDLELAVLVDVLSTVGSATFFALGIASAASLVTLSTPVMLAAGTVVGVGTFWAQMATDPNKDSGSLWDWTQASQAPGHFMTGVEYLPKEGLWMVSNGVRGFAKFAGHALGFMGTAFSAVEAYQTNQDENLAEENVQRLREHLAGLQSELRQRMSLNYLAQMHEAAAKALLEDFRNGDASCNNGLIMRNPSATDMLIVPDDRDGGGFESVPSSPVTDGPVLKAAPPRNSRNKLIRN